MFTGSIVALITPFDEKGEVDFTAFEELVERQVDAGTDGLVLCGSTGEGALLSEREKLQVFQRGVEVSYGRIPIIANTGVCATRESVELTQKAKELGVDGAIAIVPYYCKPSEEGCFAHFSLIAEVGLPLIVYHHPARTGLKLSKEGLVRMGTIPGVVGIKEGSGDLEFAKEALALSTVPFLSSDDPMANEQLAAGFAGSISIIGNLVPREWSEFVKTKKGFEGLFPLCESLCLETNPQGVKYGASVLGLCSSKMRLPLMEPTKATQAVIKRELEKVARLVDQLRH